MIKQTHPLDVSMVQPAAGPGYPRNRMCWGCSKPRADLGGKTDRRTRLWTCAGCQTAASASATATALVPA